MSIAIGTRQEGEVTVLEIQGSIDGFTADALLQSLTDQIQNGGIRLVADFSGVDYTSSAGLRALLATLKDARQHGGDLRLAGVRPDVFKVLQLSGFTGILKTFEHTAAAVQSYGA